MLLSVPLALAPAQSGQAAALLGTTCAPPAVVPEVPTSPVVLAVAGMAALGALALIRRRRRAAALAVSLLLAAVVIPWAAGVIDGAQPVVAASTACAPPPGGGSSQPSSGADQAGVSAAGSALDAPRTGAALDINLSLVLVAGGIVLLSLGGGTKPRR